MGSQRVSKAKKPMTEEQKLKRFKNQFGGMTKEEVRELRNANKKAVKAEAREKRKTKTPKKVKKAKHKKKR